MSSIFIPAGELCPEKLMCVELPLLHPVPGNISLTVFGAQNPQPGGAQQHHQQQGAARPANVAAPQGAQQPVGAAQQPQGAAGERPAGAAPAAGNAWHAVLVGQKYQVLPLCRYTLVSRAAALSGIPARSEGPGKLLGLNG